VRIEAAAALASQDDTDSAIATLVRGLDHDQPEVVLHSMRTLELLGDAARPVRPAIARALTRAQENEANSASPVWMFVRFSAEATLQPWD
jgi:hypothetical protein